jgi:hypothetical protein
MVTASKDLFIYFSFTKNKNQKERKKLGFSGVSISDQMESISTQKATDSGNPFNFMPLCFCYV